MIIWKRWRGAPREMPPLHWRPLSATEDEDYGSREVDRLKTESGTPRKTVAILCCRNGHRCALVVGVETRFTVSAEGIIAPSVQCPVGGCSGHEGPPSQLDEYGQA
jgi:hypothetical protein